MEFKHSLWNCSLNNKNFVMGTKKLCRLSINILLLMQQYFFRVYSRETLHTVSRISRVAFLTILPEKSRVLEFKNNKLSLAITVCHELIDRVPLNVNPENLTNVRAVQSM